MISLAPILTPHGALLLAEADEGIGGDEKIAARLRQAFAAGSGHGLLCLGTEHVGTAMPHTWSYWRDFGTRYVTALCALPGLGESSRKPMVPLPPDEDLERLAGAAPPMQGAEYLTPATLAELWRQTDATFDTALAAAGVSVQEFLKARNPAWNLVGRVHFNLAENRKDEEAPFAFLATYPTRLSAGAKPQHLPLGKALQEYAGARNRERLLSLLMPVQRAAEQCSWLKAMVDAGEIYHPLRWTPQQAVQLLKDVGLLEGAGIVVRTPANWRMNRPARPQVKASVGAKPPSRLGLDALLDFRVEVTLDGDALTRAEIKKLLAQTEGLALVRGNGSRSTATVWPGPWSNSRRSNGALPRKACRSPRRCAWWPAWERQSIPVRKSIPTGPAPSRVPGLPRRWVPCVGRKESRASISTQG